MIRSYSRGARLGLVLIVLAAGAVIGSGLSEALSAVFPVFGRSVQLGVRMDEVTLAGVITFGLNFHLKVNLGTAIGLIIAAWLLRGR